MTILGQVHNGQLVLDRPLPWPEGTRVCLQPLEESNGQAAVESAPEFEEERWDWEAHIETRPRRPARQVTVQFSHGLARSPRIGLEDTEA